MRTKLIIVTVICGTIIFFGSIETHLDILLATENTSEVAVNFSLYISRINSNYT